MLFSAALQNGDSIDFKKRPCRPVEVKDQGPPCRCKGSRAAGQESLRALYEW